MASSCRCVFLDRHVARHPAEHQVSAVGELARQHQFLQPLRRRRHARVTLAERHHFEPVASSCVVNRVALQRSITISRTRNRCPRLLISLRISRNRRPRPASLRSARSGPGRLSASCSAAEVRTGRLIVELPKQRKRRLVFATDLDLLRPSDIAGIEIWHLLPGEIQPLQNVDRIGCT